MVDPVAVGPVLTLRVASSGEKLEVRPARLVVAGYTGRDQGSVRHHIEELAAIGIAPPPTVPMLYELDPALLTTASEVPVSGPQTSGEVEPVYVRRGGRWYLGVGSDHTDRALEAEDIRTSKAACGKPVSTMVVALPADVVEGGFDETWARIAASSSVDGQPYQIGTLAELRPPSDLLSRVIAHVDHEEARPDVVVYSGTVPLLDGEFRFGSSWSLSLKLPEATIGHTYTAAPPTS